MKALGLGSILVSSALLVGCGGDSDGNFSSDRSTETQATASLRALHLSPDAPAVDVAVGGAVALEDVTYRQASGFLSVAAVQTDIEVRVADTTTVVIPASFDLEEGTKYTVIAVNNVADIEPLVIIDSDVPAEGTVELTVVHGAPGVDAVDVYVSGPDAAFEDLTPLLVGVPFKGVSDELEVPAGDYRVRVTLAGEVDVVFDSGTLSLLGGVEYIAVASEVDTGLSPIGLTILTDVADIPVAIGDDARTRLRVVHGSADAPEVDVLVEEDEVLDEVPFGVASGYLELLGDNYDVTVAISESGSSVISANLDLDAQQDYTVIALNAAADIEPLVLEDDNTAPGEGNIKLRLVHAAVTAGDVDIYITAPGASIADIEPNIEDFMFKEDSGYLEVPAGDYQVRITLANTKTVAIDTGGLTLEAGVVRTAIALDPAPESDSFTALLLADLN